VGLRRKQGAQQIPAPVKRTILALLPPHLKRLILEMAAQIEEEESKALAEQNANPPFKLARAFVERALKLGAKKTAIIFPTARLNAARWLEPLPFAKIYLLTPRPSMPPGEVIARGERPGGGKTDFAWMVFDHSHIGPPELRWLHRDGGER
jgi:hypothetical protein